jgi:hypothetical protein
MSENDQERLSSPLVAEGNCEEGCDHLRQHNGLAGVRSSSQSAPEGWFQD